MTLEDILLEVTEEVSSLECSTDDKQALIKVLYYLVAKSVTKLDTMVICSFIGMKRIPVLSSVSINNKNIQFCNKDYLSIYKKVKAKLCSKKGAI